MAGAGVVAFGAQHAQPLGPQQGLPPLTARSSENSPVLGITIGPAHRGLGSLLPGQVYVGRPSPLGNPYALGRDGSREQVIARYRRWLWAQLQALGSAQERELRRLLA
jgi:hypothetical protein